MFIKTSDLGGEFYVSFLGVISCQGRTEVYNCEEQYVDLYDPCFVEGYARTVKRIELSDGWVEVFATADGGIDVVEATIWWDGECWHLEAKYYFDVVRLQGPAHPAGDDFADVFGE